MCHNRYQVSDLSDNFVVRRRGVVKFYLFANCMHVFPSFVLHTITDRSKQSSDGCAPSPRRRSSR